MLFISKAVGSNYCEPCPWLFIQVFLSQVAGWSAFSRYDVFTGLVHVKTIA